MSLETKRGRPPKDRPATNNLDDDQRTTRASVGISTDELGRYPLVFASAFAPCGRRQRYLIVTAACPNCNGGRHVHLVPDLARAAGARRAGCGRGTYWLVVARTYAPKSSAVAA